MSVNGLSNSKSKSFSSRRTKKYTINAIRLALTTWGSYHGPNSALDPIREWDAFQSWAGLVVYFSGLFNSAFKSAELLAYVRTTIDGVCSFPLETINTKLITNTRFTRFRESWSEKNTVTRLLAFQQAGGDFAVRRGERTPQFFRRHCAGACENNKIRRGEKILPNATQRQLLIFMVTFKRSEIVPLLYQQLFLYHSHVLCVRPGNLQQQLLYFILNSSYYLRSWMALE